MLMTCFRGCFGSRQEIQLNADISSQNARLYKYKEMEAATEKFNPANKIGEGGFGSVYKGRLNDGTLVAVKVLSAMSEQGAQEFLNEVVSISGLEHENLVKLYGCCTEGGQRMLVYGYLENNSIAQTLLSWQDNILQFTWRTRTMICIGVARGLAFLHNDVRPCIVHRDIKASNILLDKDLTPKISDFGLAKLFPDSVTHISTRVAGTLGYLAPEYAIRGKLTRKADIYSFGVLLMEIIAGRRNVDKTLSSGEQNLLEMAWTLYDKGELVQLVDAALGDDFNIAEACRYVRVALTCTQDNPKSRPSMSVIVKMLKGEIHTTEEKLMRPRLLTDVMNPTGSHKVKDVSLASESSTHDRVLLSRDSNSFSFATMSFSSIFDRDD